MSKETSATEEVMRYRAIDLVGVSTALLLAVGCAASRTSDYQLLDASGTLVERGKTGRQYVLQYRPLNPDLRPFPAARFAVLYPADLLMDSGSAAMFVEIKTEADRRDLLRILRGEIIERQEGLSSAYSRDKAYYSLADLRPVCR